jgi:alpha-tubulin suppressor-like RCC1 family protein
MMPSTVAHCAFGFGDAWLGVLGPQAAAVEKSGVETHQRLDGQLPIPSLPMHIPDIGAAAVASADCGWGHSAFLDADGTLVLFGRPHDFKNTLKHIHTHGGPFAVLQSIMHRLTALLFPEEAQSMVFKCPDTTDEFAAVTCSMGALTAVTTRRGRVYLVGQNFFGQCGVGVSDPEILYEPGAPALRLGEPQPVAPGGPRLANPTNPDSGTADGSADAAETDPVATVSCGFEHVLAATRSGALYAWGRGDRGQLGHGDKDAYMAPARVLGPSEVFLDEKIVAVEANVSQSACLTARGDLYVWGKMQGLVPKGGRADNHVMEDQMIPRLVDVPPWEADHTMLLASDRPTAGAGEVAHSAAVEGSHMGANARPKVTHVTAGQAHFSFLTDDGRLWMLGLRGRGRTFDDSDLLAPQLQSHLDGLLRRDMWTHVISLCGATSAHVASAALLHQRVKGLLSLPELGAGSVARSEEPMAAVQSQRTGSFHTGLVSADVPLPETHMQITPMQIPLGPLAGRRIVRLRSDMHFSYAITDDGMVWRWGWKGIVLPMTGLLHLRVADVAFGYCHGIVLARTAELR